MLLFVSDGVYFFFFIFLSCLDTTLKSTTTACLSWNRPLTRLLEASLAQSSLTCLKKLSTCWCIMTGKDTSNIRSLRHTHAYTHTNKNVYKLAYWCKKKKKKRKKLNPPKQNNWQPFAFTPIHAICIHIVLYNCCICIWVNCILSWIDLRSLLTMKTILNAKRKSMLFTRYVH